MSALGWAASSFPSAVLSGEGRGWLLLHLVLQTIVTSVSAHLVCST